MKYLYSIALFVALCGLSYIANAGITNYFGATVSNDVSGTSILSSYALTDSTAQSLLTNGIYPDYPRNIEASISENSGSDLSVTLTVTGINALGASYSETIGAITDAGGTVKGNVAWSSISSVVANNTDREASDTISIGWSNKLGFPFDLRSSTGLYAPNSVPYLIKDGDNITPLLNSAYNTFAFNGSVTTSFTNNNNDNDIYWDNGSSSGDTKTITWHLPAAADGDLTVSEDVNNNVNVYLGGDSAITTTRAAGGGTDDFTVTHSDNDYTFTHNGTWDLSSVSAGDVALIENGNDDFSDNNLGVFRIKTVTDGSHLIIITSSDGTNEATIDGSITIYSMKDAKNTGSLIQSAIEGLSNYRCVLTGSDDGTGSVDSADFTSAGADENIVTSTVSDDNVSGTYFITVN